ncbi:hypothetical protein [Novipirellula artificiosorum]|uniref:Uncharacterized protein n=1 Tax=Novipirellula artificiosorum TaxID=2528016 RepID=A0A5C6CW77_9BACT|nr:hypothetical protein [Novipirellula artificiosorum]TWU27964.1 hypothetical protein Poly41_69870 [Novipirellula artificiosorum]
MCERCQHAERTRMEYIRGSLAGRGRTSLVIPQWANRGARQYLEALCFPQANAAVLFGRQLIWTSVSPRRPGYHQGSGRPTLSDAEMFEFFPREREFYESHLSPNRTWGHFWDRFRSGDDLWEALYQTYQLWNRDMYDLVYSQHHQPSRARRFLSALDSNLHAQIVHAMINVATTSIAPGTGRGLAWTVNEIAKQIASAFGRDTSLPNAIVTEAERQPPPSLNPYRDWAAQIPGAV